MRGKFSFFPPEGSTSKLNVLGAGPGQNHEDSRNGSSHLQGDCEKRDKRMCRHFLDILFNFVKFLFCVNVRINIAITKCVDYDFTFVLEDDPAV